MSHGRKKSDCRERTLSSDENSSEAFHSKDKYTHSSSDIKKREKHKKTKMSIKNQADSSSESDEDYDRRKENKISRKRKKKSPNDKYEKKSLNDKYEKKSHKRTKEHFETSRESVKEKNESFDENCERKYLGKSYKNKDQNRSEKQDRDRPHNAYDDDMSSRMGYSNSRNSKKRNRSQERQRFGKWADAADGNKELLSGTRWKDTEREERSSKYSKKDMYSSDYSRDTNINLKDGSVDNSHRISRRDRDSERYNENSHRERHSRKRMSQSYVDLDDPNEKTKSTFNENNLNTDDAGKDDKKSEDIEPLSKRLKIGNINTRTGGAYIPPAKLRMMQEKIKDKSSEEYQRIAWEALKKSIVGMTNKVNSSNIAEIVQDLFKENIIRGRGVLVRAIMQAQGASPTFTRVYAALVSIINTKFPEIGELILQRLIIQYKRGFRRNDKTVCMTAARFLAHLLNQEVAHEVLILEIVTHLLEKPSEDSVEVAIATLKECGKKLTQLTPRGMRAITQRVRDVLHEGSVDQRVRYMIEVFFAVQKDGFKDFEIIPPELDLVEDEDKYTHLINLDDAVDGQDILNIFKFDPNYLENEEKYKSVVREILGDSDEEGSGAESGSEEEEEEVDGDEENKEEKQQIVDMTETNVICLRRKIYLTIQSSLDFEECAHKLLKLELKPGQILEMCYMILDCCAQQRTYEKFFGLLAQRFCQLNKVYVEPFTEIFKNSYKTIHRLETNKLRNVAKFFAHLLYTDAISWEVLSIIKLNEEDTTSSSRIFIKILFQELCEYMGLPKLNARVKDVTLQEAFDGLFPRDHPHNTRFAINFFTSIGLGGLTDELREHLKNLPKNPIIPVAAEEKASSVSSSSSSSTSSSSSSSDSD